MKSIIDDTFVCDYASIDFYTVSYCDFVPQYAVCDNAFFTDYAVIADDYPWTDNCTWFYLNIFAYIYRAAQYGRPAYTCIGTAVNGTMMKINI